MNTDSGVEPTYNGHTADELSDLTGLDSALLAAKLENPRTFTLAEVVEVAPRLGYTPTEYVTVVLA